VLGGCTDASATAQDSATGAVSSTSSTPAPAPGSSAAPSSSACPDAAELYSLLPLDNGADAEPTTPCAPATGRFWVFGTPGLRRSRCSTPSTAHGEPRMRRNSAGPATYPPTSRHPSATQAEHTAPSAVASSAHRAAWVRNKRWRTLHRMLGWLVTTRRSAACRALDGQSPSTAMTTGSVPERPSQEGVQVRAVEAAAARCLDLDASHPCELNSVRERRGRPGRRGRAPAGPSASRPRRGTGRAGRPRCRPGGRPSSAAAAGRARSTSNPA
jgi:hypothetical protein